LTGMLTFRYGDGTCQLTVGDSISFDAAVLHGPVEFNETPVQVLMFISRVGSS
jgi:hypothetical protein